MVAFDSIAEYELLRARLKAIENGGKWDCQEALELDQRLVELERHLPDDYVHPNDLEYERKWKGDAGDK